MKKIQFKLEELLSGTGVKINGNNIILDSEYLTKMDYTAPSGSMFKQGFNCLTEDDFVKICIDLFKKAIKNYSNLKNVMTHYRMFDSVMNMLEDAEKYEKVFTEVAEKKYKKEFYKNKFISDMMSGHNMSSLMKIPTTETETLDRWFFDSHFGSDNGVSEYRIEKGELTEETLKRLEADIRIIFNRINGHEIMQYAKDIKISYQTYDKYMMRMSWPTLSFTFSKEGEEIISKNRETLCRAIENFYKNTTYWGD